MEVQPSDQPPVRYRGRTWIRIGPRRDIASPAEETMLAERKARNFTTFDAHPCFGASLDDLDLDLFESQYVVPEGMAYNSYLILDEKVAILDTVDARKGEAWKVRLAGCPSSFLRTAFGMAASTACTRSKVVSSGFSARCSQMIRAILAAHFSSP